VIKLFYYWLFEKRLPRQRLPAPTKPPKSEQRTDELKAIRQKPNEELIGFLENMLGDAKEGRLQGLIFAKVWDDDTTGNGWSVKHKYLAPKLIGEIFMTMTALSNNTDGIDSRIIYKGK